MPPVLLVAPSSQVAASLIAWLTEAGHQVGLATSFAAGKARLEEPVSLLVAEVRLGDYNGLHLAIRARSRGIPAIVLGEPDPVLQREAAHLGVEYIADFRQRTSVLEAVRRLEPAAVGQPPVPMPASNVSFVSWDELGPALGSGDASSGEQRRRTLPS